MIQEGLVRCTRLITCLVQLISVFVILVLLVTIAGMKVSQTTPQFHAQWVNTALMPQTAQSHVQMEPSEILPEGETFPIVTSALPVASVHCPIAVSGAMNVKMALSVHRVELLLLCAWQDISVTRPRLSYPALQDIIVLRHHPRPFLVQRDTIATHCITAITIPYIETRVLVTPRFALLVTDIRMAPRD